MWLISYWLLPLISAFVWVGMLVSMLAYWCTIGRPHYASMESNQSIAYISDIGAQTLKPLFIAGSCVTTIFLDLSFVSERWLRHKGRLAKNTTLAEKILSGFAMIFAVIGTAGLILLSIFDTLRHPRLHDIFLLLFIAGYVIAAIFICAEYQRLGIHFREHRVLRISFWMKLAFIVIEVVLAIAFGACNFKGARDAAAVIEWTIAFIFTFWVLSFIVDLAPVSSRTASKYAGSETEMQVESNDPASQQMRTGYGNNGTGDDHNATYMPNGNRNTATVAQVRPSVADNF